MEFHASGFSRFQLFEFRADGFAHGDHVAALDGRYAQCDSRFSIEEQSVSRWLLVTPVDVGNVAEPYGVARNAHQERRDGLFAPNFAGRRDAQVLFTGPGFSAPTHEIL